MRLADDPKRAATYAAFAFGIAGVFTLITTVGNDARIEGSGGSTAPLVGIAIAAMVVAAVIPWLPWPRWGMRSTLVLPVLGLAMLIAAEVLSRSSRTVDGVMSTSTIVTLIFVWIGLTQSRGKAAMVAPFVAVGLALAFESEGAPISVVTTVMGVCMAAGLGELVAWVKHYDIVRSEELGLVIDGTTDLRSETDQVSAAKRLVATVVDLLGVPNVAAYLPAPDGAFQLAATAGGLPWDTSRAVTHDDGLAVRTVPAGIELSVPLVGRAGHLRGLVVATGRRRHDEFMIRLAQILGEQAGALFDDLAQIDALSDESRRDALTGVGNRRFADEMLTTLQPGDVVAVVDLDDLRGINALAGHQGGDVAIRDVANHLVAAVRSEDWVARLGGDEFVIVLRQAGADAATMVERITDTWNCSHVGNGISVGATVHGGGDPEATLRSADEALFVAKRHGRARAEVRTGRIVEDAAGF
jgi:diguanylate cyclase (GGDEF)-like protein